MASQVPQWAALPVRPVVPDGWNNRTYRLGDELVVRLPTASGYVAAVEKEAHWLPVLSSVLPLPVPEPVAVGRPGEGYPHPWSVRRWLPGAPARAHRIEDLDRFAVDLAEFLLAREAALAARWPRPPVWFHGDVASGNLLVDHGRLAAVIDFGTCGIGDPSCDLVMAWTFFTGTSRDIFRAALGHEDATWARARGWALWKALISLPADLGGQAATVDLRTIEAVLADHLDHG